MINKEALDRAYCIHVQYTQYMQKEANIQTILQTLQRAGNKVGNTALNLGGASAVRTAGKAWRGVRAGVPITKRGVGMTLGGGLAVGGVAAGVHGFREAETEKTQPPLTPENAQQLAKMMNKADAEPPTPKATAGLDTKDTGRSAIAGTLGGAAGGAALAGGASALYGRLKQLPNRKRDILLAILGAGAGSALGYHWSRGGSSDESQHAPTKPQE